MKITKRIKLRQRPRRVTQHFIVFDEFHAITSSPEYRHAVLDSVKQFRRPGAGIVVTQAILRSNSGKRVRFLGSARRQDGSPLTPTPKKFIPLQVARRQQQAWHG